MKQVPFFPNSKNNLRCYQACLRMVLKYFEPNKSYSWKQLDELTGRQTGKGTWPTQSWLNFKKLGYDQVIMEDFDFHALINDPVAYLTQKYGPQAASSQIKMSNLPHEVKMAKQYVRQFSPRPNPPTLKDITRLLNQGYLIITNVNYYPLHNKSGFSGHFILIYDRDDHHVRLHDPGLPPYPSATIPLKHFLKAWHYPNPSTANLHALKLKPQIRHPL